jgi:predicted nucleotidyltransferase
MKKTEKRIIRKALQELQTALADLYGEESPAMILYGSQARGEATEASDIDLLLIYPKVISAGSEIRQISPILANLNLRYQVLISILPVSKSDYLASSGMFWKNVHREGISVHAV